jgi:transglutaminase-like putative cysteine protease
VISDALPAQQLFLPQGGRPFDRQLARSWLRSVPQTSPHHPMQIRVGFEMSYQCVGPTPMILALSIHYSRASDLVRPDLLVTQPAVPVTAYRDLFGNWCSRLVAPPGRFVLRTDALVNDSGRPDPVLPQARQIPVEQLPEETLVYLLGSRYCDTDRLSDFAWAQFGDGPTGWARVQAVCDFVHQHIAFGYEHANPRRTAWEAFHERRGVCRDFAHLGIALCRCLNIPARYCTGYLGDIGMPPPYGPMDFAGWMEVWLDGAWHTFDPRNNEPRIGRVLIARGRDACDVALSSTFGPNTLEGFKVWTDEVAAA